MTTDLPKEPSREVSVDEGDPHPRPEDPVPLSVDPVDPVAIPTPGRTNRGQNSMNVHVEVPRRRQVIGAGKSDPAPPISFRKNV